MIELHEPQITAQIERRDIEQIIEEPDGKVVLKFRSLSFHEERSQPGLALQTIGDLFLISPHKQEIWTLHTGTDFVLLFRNP